MVLLKGATFSALQPKSWILILAIVTVLISTIYSFVHRIEPVVDARAYDSIAQNIVAGHGYREDMSVDIYHDPSIVRAGPLYEYFLAGIYTVFGHHYEMVWTIQAILRGLTVLLLYASAVLLFKERGQMIGLISGMLFGLWPDLIEISAMLMTETLYLFLTALIIYLFSKAIFGSTKLFSLSALLGSIIALGTLTRPPLLLLLPIVAWWYLRKHYYRAVIMLILAFAIVMTPWIVRNYRVYDRLVITTMIGDYNVWIGNRVDATGGQTTTALTLGMEYVTAYGYTNLPDKVQDVFLSFIGQHPLLFIKLCVIRLVRYFSLIRPMGFWFYQTGASLITFVVASGVWIAFVFLLGLAGMVRWLRERTKNSGYLIAMAITAVIVTIPTVVQSRYRFQIYPFFCLAAAYLLVNWRNQSQLTRVCVTLAVIAIGVLTAVDIFTSLDTISGRLLHFSSI